MACFTCDGSQRLVPRSTFTGLGNLADFRHRPIVVSPTFSSRATLAPVNSPSVRWFRRAASDLAQHL
jgi:hypothetical protein